MEIKKLGILDFGYRPHRVFQKDSIFSVVKEAIYLEKLGFSEIWYTEHYTQSINYMWSSPELLIPIVASYTNKIRVGIAGSTVRYHSPISITKNYKFLSTLFENRIDLGFSKGVQEPYYTPYFELSAKCIEDIHDPDGVNRRIQLIKELTEKEYGEGNPKFWNLVVSGHGYATSLKFGMNCARSLIHPATNKEPEIEKLDQYRTLFFKYYGIEPEVKIVLGGSCQKVQKKAKELLKFHVNLNQDNLILGEASEVLDKISFYCDQYNIQDVVFNELASEESERNYSFRKISQLISKKENVIFSPSISL